MPVLCNHEHIASSERTPRSREPVARLNKKSVDILDLDELAVVVSGRLVGLAEDMSGTDIRANLRRTGRLASFPWLVQVF